LPNAKTAEKVANNPFWNASNSENPNNSSEPTSVPKNKTTVTRKSAKLDFVSAEAKPKAQVKSKRQQQKKAVIEDLIKLEEVLTEIPESNCRTHSKVDYKDHELIEDWKRQLELETGLKFEQNVDYSPKKSKTKYVADLGIDNILIEINPNVSSNSSIHVLHFNGTCQEKNCEHSPVSETHHQERTEIAASVGKILIPWFEWDSAEELASQIMSARKYGELWLERSAGTPKLSVQIIGSGDYQRTVKVYDDGYSKHRLRNYNLNN